MHCIGYRYYQGRYFGGGIEHFAPALPRIKLAVGLKPISHFQ